MELAKLKWETDAVSDIKAKKELEKMHALYSDITSRKIPEEVIHKINVEIEKLNAVEFSDLKKMLVKTFNGIIKILYEDMKWVPISYYQTLWMSLGLAVFGVPMGVAFSAALGNYAFIGIGLPIGMVIGMAIGRKKDETAKKNGLQLNVNV